VEACHGSIIAAILNGEHTIKRLHIGRDGIELRPENPCYRPIRIKERRIGTGSSAGAMLRRTW
jgi:DNA polymerase V